jgi:hypothetical protein
MPPWLVLVLVRVLKAREDNPAPDLCPSRARSDQTVDRRPYGGRYTPRVRNRLKDGQKDGTVVVRPDTNDTSDQKSGTAPILARVRDLCRCVADL